MSLLKLDRIGPIFSDRMVLGKESEGVNGLHADHSLFSWLMRLVSWIWSPCCYTSENRRTIACLKKYLIDQIGAERLHRVSSHYDMNLDKMETQGRPLFSRDIAKIMIGIKDVKIEDIDELIELAKKWPENINPELHRILRKASTFDSLNDSEKALARAVLVPNASSDQLDQLIKLAKIWPLGIDPATHTILKKAQNSEGLPSAVFAKAYKALGSIARTEDVDQLIELSKLWPKELDVDLHTIFRQVPDRKSLNVDDVARVKAQLCPKGSPQQLNAMIDHLIENAKRWPEGVDFSLHTILAAKNIHNKYIIRNYYDLKKDVLARIYQQLKLDAPFAIVPAINKELSGAEPSERIARNFFDPLLADRERLVLAKENPTDSEETFIHNFVVRIIGREMKVGTLIPAPNRKIPRETDSYSFFGETESQFYTVAAKIISGDGMVSYLLMPSAADTDLKPILFFRGTSTRLSGIDSSSTMITDMEKELARSCYESGEIYIEKLKEIFSKSKISLAAGHSLGSTTLQYIVANDLNGDIEKAYFFNGPGLPPGEVDEFNKRMRDKELPLDGNGSGVKLKLVIRDSNTDIFSTVGTKHLGYKAPREKVDIDYFKYFPRYKTGTGYAHVQVPDRENRFVGMQGFNEKEIDTELHRAAHPGRLILCMPNETLRQLIGPTIGAVIRFVRNIFRFLFGSRVLSQLGMQYGQYNEQTKKWETFHGKLDRDKVWSVGPLRSKEIESKNALNPDSGMELPIALAGA